MQPVGGADHRAAMEALTNFTREHATALWGRALEAWPRYLASLAVFRNALAAEGCAPREMDQLGAMLAGWWVMVEDRVPDERLARGAVAGIRPHVRSAEDVRGDDGPQRALDQFQSTLVQRDRSTDLESVGALINQVFTLRFQEDSDVAARVLGRLGVRPVRAGADGVGRPSPNDGVFLSLSSHALANLFRNTPFDHERWRVELQRHAGARRWKGNVRIGGLAQKCFWMERTALDPEYALPPGAAEALTLL